MGYLLKEDGGRITLEDGSGFILLDEVEPPTPPSPAPRPSPYPPLYDASPRGGGGGGPFVLAEEHLTVSAREMERRREERAREAADELIEEMELDDVVAAVIAKLFL